MEPVRVIIVGGGYAGIKALEVLAVSGACEVLLIDQHPYHFLQTDAYEFIANECSMTQVSIDLTALCFGFGPHVTYVKDTIRSVDFENRRVIGDHGGHAYDYLLLCSGSRTAYYDSVKGLKEHAHGVKTLSSALTFKQQFEQRLYSRMESEGGWCGDPFTIAIGGGGLSGVEIAAEMANFVRVFHRENTLTCENIHIYLIIPHENVLEGMSRYLIDQATKRLQQLDVRIINHSRIVSVEEHSLALDNGNNLDFDFMIFTGGIVASTLTAGIDAEKNKKSQLIVDTYLRLQGRDRIFAAGDIAQMQNAEGKPVPFTAHSAEQGGTIAAENILASIRGVPMRPGDIRMRGIMVALGGHYAAIELFGFIRLGGWLGYRIKTAVMRRYRNGILRHCELGIKKMNGSMPHCQTHF